MNERIRELAEKTFNETIRVGELDFSRFYEKFAELIVKECVGVELYWLNEQDRKAVAEKIKQHFGVEQ